MWGKCPWDHSGRCKRSVNVRAVQVPEITTLTVCVCVCAQALVSVTSCHTCLSHTCKMTVCHARCLSAALSLSIILQNKDNIREASHHSFTVGLFFYQWTSHKETSCIVGPQLETKGPHGCETLCVSSNLWNVGGAVTAVAGHLPGLVSAFAAHYF